MKHGAVELDVPVEVSSRPIQFLITLHAVFGLGDVADVKPGPQNVLEFPARNCQRLLHVIEDSHRLSVQSLAGLIRLDAGAVNPARSAITDAERMRPAVLNSYVVAANRPG